MRKIEQKWANMYPHFSFSREINFVKAFILNGYLKLSFCFHHLLPIFSITINTPIPRLRSFTRISLPPIFCFVTPHLPFQVSIDNKKIDCLREFCIAKNMTSTWMMTLKNFVRCPEYIK